MNSHILPDNTYTIRFDSSYQHEEQYGWFVGVQQGHAQTSRTPTTQYAKVEKLFGGILSDRQWQFTPAEGGTVVISLASSGPYKGFELISAKINQYDERDQWSNKAFIAAPGHGLLANKWRLQYLGDSIYLIQNSETGFFLSAHRFVANDKISDNQTLLITHSNIRTAGCWKVTQY